MTVSFLVYLDYTVIRVTATDADSPATSNGQIDFSIQSGAQGKFTVVNAKRNGNFFEADIVTTADATFNYETQNQYVMTVSSLSLSPSDGLKISLSC